MAKVTEFQAEQLRILQPEIFSVDHFPTLIFGGLQVGSCIFERFHHRLH